MANNNKNNKNTSADSGPINDEVQQSGNDLSSIIILFKYGRGLYGLLALSISLIMASSTVLMISAKTLGSLVETIVTGAPTPRLASFGIMIMLLELANVALTYYGRTTLAFVTNKIALNIRLTLFAKITRLPIAYFDHQPLGRTITRLTNDVEGVENFFGSTLARVLSAVITVVSIVIAMFMTNVKVGLVVSAAAVPSIFLTFAVKGPIRHWNRLFKIRSARCNALLAEYINGFPIIKAFGLEDWSYTNFKKASRDLLDAGIGLVNVNSLVRPAINFLCFIPIVVLLWWGGQRVLEGSLAIGMLVSFVRYAERFARPIIALSNEIHVMQEAITSSERVRQMLDEAEESDVLGPTGVLNQKIEGHVRYRDIWMNYDSSTPILKGISFDIKKGMKVGLVGETGSGKTTTLNLLPQLYPTLKGMIEIDGQPIELWNRDVIRSQLGLVSQDIVVFRGTLRENLLVGSVQTAKISDDRLMHYCQQTGLDVVMRRFAAGLDTKIFDGGDNLSVGERQLIAFTRMLIRNPAVLILDEATSNIDAQCELMIQKAIAELMKDRTCFVIAHRLNTILLCDEILVFQDGTIVERGRHQELIARGGHYRELAHKQIAAELAAGTVN